MVKSSSYAEMTLRVWILRLTHPDVLKYSGHQDTFTDPLVDCKSCGLRFREDQIPEQCIGEELTEPRDFNLMFRQMSVLS